MNDYIRKAVEQANWFDYDEDHGNFIMYDPDDGHAVFVVGGSYSVSQWFQDSLAAQLVRQVDSNHHVDITWMTCEIRDGETGKRLAYHEFRGTTPPYEGCSRTMNTIKAIVDSKVLEVPTDALKEWS